MTTATPVLPGEAAFVPSGPGDLRYQKWLQDSQWWPGERLLEHQLDLLGRLLAHAHASVPLLRARIEAAGVDPAIRLTLDDWRRLPVLGRREVQHAGASLASSAVPAEHGAVLTNTSSGSTGAPISVLGTEFDAWIFKALNLRRFLWHPHDFAGRYVTIRSTRHRGAGQSVPLRGANYARWGDTATFPFATGPSADLPISASIREQAQWLVAQDPDYLLSYPSNLMGLAEHFETNRIVLPHLEHVATIGEAVGADVRDAVRRAWDVPLIDTYSAQETGLIADQCPEHEHYHVPSEAILVEVVDDSGQPCGPGQVGRVLVTPLFNYAMPLLRYELGDYAEVGPACPCGRGLPVLKRILGRERNALLVTPTGERYWPTFGSRQFESVAPVFQHQFVQKDADWIEGRLVTGRPLTQDEEARLREIVQSRLPCPFRITFSYFDDIARNAGGKFENFVSELPRKDDTGLHRS